MDCVCAVYPYTISGDLLHMCGCRYACGVIVRLVRSKGEDNDVMGK